MRKYSDMVGEVMAFLNRNHYSQTVTKYNQRYFDELGHHLLTSETAYTPSVADQWFQSINPSLSQYASENYRVVLNKIRNAYETGIIRSGCPMIAISLVASTDFPSFAKTILLSYFFICSLLLPCFILTLPVHFLQMLIIFSIYMVDILKNHKCFQILFRNLMF